ncbi:hypothetical protein [Sinorhizobium medicae]
MTGRSPQPETTPDQNEHGEHSDILHGWSRGVTFEQAIEKLDVKAFGFFVGIGFRHWRSYFSAKKKNERLASQATVNRLGLASAFAAVFPNAGNSWVSLRMSTFELLIY